MGFIRGCTLASCKQKYYSKTCSVGIVIALAVIAALGAIPVTRHFFVKTLPNAFWSNGQGGMILRWSTAAAVGIFTMPLLSRCKGRKYIPEPDRAEMQAS